MAGQAAVTGATGFLGRHVVGALVSGGWRVRILARRAPDQPRLERHRVETVTGDVTDRSALDALIDGAEIVIHAAGLVKARDAAAFRAVNAAGTANIVAAVNDSPSAKRLILVSSMAAREPQLSAYAASKREGEAALTALRRAAWSAVRPCAVYGPWDGEMLAMFRAASRGFIPMAGPRDGRVALIHAADAAAAIVALCGSDESRRIFELTDPRVDGYSWPEIGAALETALGTRGVRLRLPAPVMHAAAAANALLARLAGRTAMFDPGKAREILHADWGSAPERQPPGSLWRPRIDLDSGFRETVSWYRERGWLGGAAGRARLANEAP